MTIIDIQCYDCEATLCLTFDMDERLYKTQYCPCCGSDNIELEEREEDEEDDWE